MSLRPTLNTAKKVIGWLPTHALYYVGAGFCVVLESLPDWQEGFKPEWIPNTLYRCYSGCMNASVGVNDWAGLKVWRFAGDESE